MHAQYLQGAAQSCAAFFYPQISAQPGTKYREKTPHGESHVQSAISIPPKEETVASMYSS
jgi:hypothetical protein